MRVEWSIIDLSFLIILIFQNDMRPTSTLKYVCYFNAAYMKVCCSVRAFKYLYKYVYKGSDRTTIEVAVCNPGNQPANANGRRQRDMENDEILQYLDARYVGPCEAAWRLSGFEMHVRQPAITRLQVQFRFIQKH